MGSCCVSFLEQWRPHEAICCNGPYLLSLDSFSSIINSDWKYPIGPNATSLTAVQLSSKPQTIDVDDEKKNCQVGVASLHHWIADDSRIPKNALFWFFLKSQFFICKLKKAALSGLSIANPSFSEIDSSVWYFLKVGSLKFSFQAIEFVFFRCMKIVAICNFRNPNLSVQIQVFLKLALRNWRCWADGENQPSSHLESMVLTRSQFPWNRSWPASYFFVP